jgi:hypothetical protein
VAIKRQAQGLSAQAQDIEQKEREGKNPSSPLFKSTRNFNNRKERAMSAQAMAADGIELGHEISACAQDLFECVEEVRYEHKQGTAAEQVCCQAGTWIARTDCSGFVSYVLNKVVPQQYEAILRQEPSALHPHARTFALFLRALRSDVSRDGWIKVASYKELKRGDIVAWVEGHAEGEAAHKNKNTGHVMIVADMPGQVQEEAIAGKKVRFVPVSVIDASSVEHFPPEVLPPCAHQDHRNGLGKGVVRLILDDHDQVIGYWEGTYSHERQEPIDEPLLSDAIAFGRAITED